ncbi:MAG: glycosyltransferase family 39 protein, partial [Clostridia bacterium]|nr:glycosyltransferase family 39 protein [Clostridia bacterium]
MDKKIKVIAIIAVCILVILQISALFIFSGDQIEDSEDYRDWAIEKADSNSFYPDETDANEKFMANPGFINYLSVFYRITNNDKVPIAANIVLVIIMAACVYFIAWKLFKNKIVAWLSILLLAVFPTFIGEILNLRSEILFTTLAYAAVAVFLSNIKFKYVLCGILLALANWVRPLGLVFLLAIL